MSDANKQLMRRWFQQVRNEQNKSSIREVFSADGKVHSFPETSGYVGPEGPKEVHKNFCGAFSDIHVVVEDVISEGDRIATHWTVTMPHTRDHLEIPATGRRGSCPVRPSASSAMEKIAEGWNYIDKGHLYKQFGVASA